MARAIAGITTDEPTKKAQATKARAASEQAAKEQATKALAAKGQENALLQAYRSMNLATLSIVFAGNAFLLGLAARNEQPVHPLRGWILPFLSLVLAAAFLVQYAFNGMTWSRQEDVDFWKNELSHDPQFLALKSVQDNRRHRGFGDTRSAFKWILSVLWALLLGEFGLAVRLNNAPPPELPYKAVVQTAPESAQVEVPTGALSKLDAKATVAYEKGFDVNLYNGSDWVVAWVEVDIVGRAKLSWMDSVPSTEPTKADPFADIMKEKKNSQNPYLKAARDAITKGSKAKGEEIVGSGPVFDAFNKALAKEKKKSENPLLRDIHKDVEASAPVVFHRSYRINCGVVALSAKNSLVEAGMQLDPNLSYECKVLKASGFPPKP
jgi:hypothetical protein